MIQLDFQSGIKNPTLTPSVLRNQIPLKTSGSAVLLSENIFDKAFVNIFSVVEELDLFSSLLTFLAAAECLKMVEKFFLYF